MVARNYDIVIVGGGHAGAQAAISLRQNGFTGSIFIISNEKLLPYERPALSKDYLAGKKSADRLLIRPEAFWQERNIEFLLGVRVSKIDAAGHVITTSDQGEIAYGQLIWAAGASPRWLQCKGSELGNIFSVRTMGDVDQMQAELKSPRQIIIIGGGYIGLEAAASLSKMGHDITIIEAEERLLSRVAGAPLSQFYADIHRAQGIKILLKSQVSEIIGREGKISAVTLQDGTVLPAHIAIIGIGVVPNVGPLMEAGAAVGNGVDVDTYCRTSLNDIFAIGDCASHANPFAAGAVIRLESVQNCNDMANIVAKNICGEPSEYHAVPWFWSNQYDIRLQTIGLNLGYDDIIIRGSMEAQKFSLIYTQNGHVIALDCVNNAKDYVQGKALVEARAKIDADKLANIDMTLKDIFAAETLLAE
ncbi:pyridine nucleotide-disulfide oxidoreductase [Sphingorhabdus lutea]|uniref:Pyridine nucleotide-disulfide oxidoreductase n=1 Tax=Sphingorhabdus lutea TaxID=1913578 RepID=A0A1L3JB96_9SPHN|nr:FAD-dependent oxidoreductase [Sphingorhabdus lutea]APG62401.1 pyridine nucleotide-disulfide oxidoreductase [Sphingorhabdus lutea]